MRVRNWKFGSSLLTKNVGATSVERRVALVGAGFIAAVHAEAVGLIRNARVTSVIDPRRGAAERLARQIGVEHVFDSVEEGIASGQFDTAHVLVPPDLHAVVAAPLIEAGIDVLLEKPMAASSDACDRLLHLAETSGAKIGINQNFVFDVQFQKMLSFIGSGDAGRLRSVTCIYSMPLRQLSAGQLGHWMFREPKNLLLEQAVHPLSQIIQLIGSIRDVNVSAAVAEQLTPDTLFAPSLLAHLEGVKASAQFEFRMGAEYPTWQITACCDDATLTADMISNSLTIYRRARWLEPVDRFVGGLRIAASGVGSASVGLVSYGLAMLKLRPRSDAFFQSMRGSLGVFYKALGEGRQPELDGRFGREIVALCEKLALEAGWPTTTTPEASLNRTGAYDILVIGGTGFIGKAVVEKLLKADRRVGVMARSVAGLGALFYDPKVTIIQGDIASKADLEKAISSAHCVINLAHGGGGDNWEEISEAMVGGARRVAEACLKHSTEQLVHVSSIAGLYLGYHREIITADTPPDVMSDKRADYSRAKADADKLLLDLHESRSLPVTILRPGIVVGRGGPAFHTGVGFFNNEQHTLGWNMGHNPLPLVLVDDVAEAVARCIDRKGVAGQAYNLVGDVRWSARRYVAELSEGLKRPLKYHPQPTFVLFLTEIGKWSIKRLAGKRAPRPTLYDLKSRSLLATFDCHKEKDCLDWHPVADDEAFRSQGILVHAGSAGEDQ